jgi:2,4-dienoyl-CoA reductase-like NADH-dependent reductase (Old Yellow Enzyme family)
MNTIRSIETFLRRTGMPRTRFGREAVRDPRLVHDLRRGRQPSDRMQRRIEHFMNIYEKGQSQ